MKTITKILVQNRDKNRVNLYLDGKFFCGLDLETAVKNSLKVGTIITEDRLTKIQEESEKQNAYNMALKLISKRYKTLKEVERYLFDKGYLAPVVYNVIEKLSEYHYIDDEKYVQSYVNFHKSTFGKNKMKQQLLFKGVNEQIIDAILNAEEFDQTDEILRLADKYMKNKEDTRENNIKLVRYLMQKGFEYETIKYALKNDIEG